MKTVPIQVKTIAESPNYNVPPNDNFKLVELSGVVITKDGMQSGNPSLDLQFVDKDGNQFVALIQGNIFRAIALIANPHYKDGGPNLVS